MMIRHLVTRYAAEILISQSVVSGECWVWSGAVEFSGYGRSHTRFGECLAHRRSYELHFGTIPDGMLVCHRCDVPRCIRPSHLFLGTVSDNIKDMWSKGRGRLVRTSGEDHPQSRLTAKQALEIRTRRLQGESLALLAKEFGVSQSTISLIGRGKIWRGTTLAVETQREPRGWEVA